MVKRASRSRLKEVKLNLKPVKKKQSVFSHARWLLFVLVPVTLAVLAAFILGFLSHREQVPRPPVLETDKNVVKKLPPDIKKELQTASPSATFRVPILLYHYVEFVQDKGDKIRQSLDIIPPVFENQVVTLQKAGYTFMTAKELGEVLDGKMALPNKPVILTFDDGYRDFYTDVYPILQAYNVKATEYVIPGFLGENNFMTEDQVKKIASQSGGLVDVGAHTVHHAWLKGLPQATAQREIKESKTMLEQLTGQPVVSFAYPYGAFDKQAIALTQDAGFTTAVTTIPGINVNQNNRFFIYRIRPGGRTGDALLGLLQQNDFKPF